MFDIFKKTNISEEFRTYYMDEIKDLTKDELFNVINDKYKYFCLPDGIWGEEFYGSIDLGDHDEYTVKQIIDSLLKSYYFIYISPRHLTQNMIIKYAVENDGLYKVQQTIISNGFNLSEFLLEYTRQKAEQGDILYFFEWQNLDDEINSFFNCVGDIFSDENIKQSRKWLMEFMTNPSNSDLVRGERDC